MKEEQNRPLALGLLSGMRVYSSANCYSYCFSQFAQVCEPWEIHAPSLEQTRKASSSSGQEAAGPISCMPETE